MKREIVFNEVYDGQEYFRQLLDSMSRPGKISKLSEMEIHPPTGLNKASALVALTLLNADVTFYVDSVNANHISSYLLLNTSSIPKEVENADYIFLNGHTDGFVLTDTQVGTLLYPEEGATCVVDVASVSNSKIPNSTKLILKGPGVESQSEVYVLGLSEGILKNFSTQNSEFPLGIDMIITDVNNNVFCIPRSIRFTWENLKDN